MRPTKVGFGTTCAERGAPAVELAAVFDTESGDAAFRLFLVEVGHQQSASVGGERDCLGTVAARQLGFVESFEAARGKHSEGCHRTWPGALGA